jgi:uncharacterized DUF497 family protein
MPVAEVRLTFLTSVLVDIESAGRRGPPMMYTLNWERHRVTPEEAKDVFFNEPLIVANDVRHSGREKRYHFFGPDHAGQETLHCVHLARDMNRREEEEYRRHEKTAS